MTIEYGVFKRSYVSIFAYDLEGRIVASFGKNLLDPDKYTITWNPSENLSKGHYFIAIKINDLQVHYIKVIKE